MRIFNSKSDKVQFESEKMGELPILVLQEIFSFLGWPERLKCKRVSKQWKFAIETAAPQFLCICERIFSRKIKWYFSEQNVIDEDTVRLNPEKLRDFHSRIELFKGLQKLCFFHVYNCDFLKDLPLLSKLKVLMVHNYYIKDRTCRDHQATLESSSLEKLSFKYCYNVENHVAIDSIFIEFQTPNLSSLIFWSYSVYDPDVNFKLKFNFPLKIRHLECIEFVSDMSVLKNLETLVCQKIVSPFTLEDFKSLQRLELFPREERELESIKAIVDEKKLLRREPLEILIWGFRDILVTFKSEQHDISIAFDLDEHFLGQVAKHSDNLVGHIPREFEFNVDFAVFSKTLKEIPKDFFEKFSNIYSVNILDDGRRRKKKFPNQSYVLQLLIQSNPKVVRTDFNFSVKFYEQLTSIQSIENLKIKENFGNINWDLFLKLNFLDTLRISTEKLPIDFISKLFKLKYLWVFIFSNSNCAIFILREREYYAFRITKGPIMKTYKHFDRLEDLIKEMKKLKKTGKAYLRGCLV